MKVKITDNENKIIIEIVLDAAEEKALTFIVTDIPTWLTSIINLRVKESIDAIAFKFANKLTESEKKQLVVDNELIHDEITPH